MLGVGVMIQSLFGNEETVNAVKSALGKTIETVKLEDNELLFKFTDGTGLKMFDDGQSCCEDRYMRTDDDLSDFEGATLLDFELKDAPTMEDEYGDHEIQFLDVKTSNGVFQMANHNEHNGYYGGFCIVARSF
ncbi:DUF7448 domain-containing protein [Runella slithyformis]|uniref:DUF7448 domain-containing protein n=1 Tax=Runella slithyformis (strain ATCC 29530 / DSM 19594 / LMG 11500 / NCIMB 11436 / LSU 4) TaxID=761193 RepID=A0A7U4E8L0_RUNSL|nr:hypothetical protein [Runella slithyformis]AEI51359.1 hypothetical protein Runsl_5050 [Runella slithyformis DSM 19594]